MSYSIIAAIGKNNELGKNNGLIWHLPNDLKFFKEMTTGHTIIMGKNTFNSLPKLLPNRHHVVLSKSSDFPDLVEVFHDINDLKQKYDNENEEEFIIGGGRMYNLFIKYADKLYLTEIDAEDKNADTYFPEFDKNEWTREILKDNEDNGIKYSHVLYKRK